MGENSPVYEVVSERNPKSKIRVLHRNLLLPCNDLPVETENANSHGNKTSNPIRLFQQKRNISKRSKRALFDAQATSDDEDDDFIFIPNQNRNTVPQMQNSVESFEDSRSLEITTDNISDVNNESGNIDNTNVPENENSGFMVQSPQAPETAGGV